MRDGGRLICPPLQRWRSVIFRSFRAFFEERPSHFRSSCGQSTTLRDTPSRGISGAKSCGPAPRVLCGSAGPWRRRAGSSPPTTAADVSCSPRPLPFALRSLPCSRGLTCIVCAHTDQFRLCPATEPLTEACFQAHPLAFASESRDKRVCCVLSPGLPLTHRHGTQTRSTPFASQTPLVTLRSRQRSSRAAGARAG